VGLRRRIHRIDRDARLQAVVFCLALLPACAPSPAGTLGAAPGSDPAASLARFRARERSIRSLRAQFVATTTHAGAERRASGVLIVRKPDRFRLRLVLPFGLTLFDYLSVGDEAWAVAPLFDGGAGDLALFSRQDLGAAFLRGDDAFAGECAPAEGPTGVEVACRACAACPPARTFLIEPASGALVEEVGYDGGGVRVILRYGVHRPVDGRLLPFRIRLEDPGRDASVDVRIQRYEVNPTLADELFRPAPRSRPGGGADRPLAGPSPAARGRE
jgi:outer membrane lipoprotein-sorting protein